MECDAEASIVFKKKKLHNHIPAVIHFHSPVHGHVWYTRTAGLSVSGKSMRNQDFLYYIAASDVNSWGLFSVTCFSYISRSDLNVNELFNWHGVIFAEYFICKKSHVHFLSSMNDFYLLVIVVADVAEGDPDADCRGLAGQSLVLLDNSLKKQLQGSN